MIKVDKKAARKKMQALIKDEILKSGEEHILKMGEDACKHFLNSLLYRTAETLCVFFPLQNEM